MPSPLTNQSPPQPIFATDEDCYVEGGGDYAVICPASTVMATGADGVFDGADLWTLISASNDFLAYAVEPGMVVQLSGPKNVFASTAQYLAVQSLMANKATLRRCGMTAMPQVGAPPSPAGGLMGVTFKVMTLKPQLESASFWLREKASVDPNVHYRTDSDIYDVRVFRRLAVLRVFYLQYQAINRTKAGDFADKVEHYRNEFDNEWASTVVRWGAQGMSQSPTGRGARLAR